LAKNFEYKKSTVQKEIFFENPSFLMRIYPQGLILPSAKPENIVLFSYGWNQLVLKYCQRVIPHTLEILNVLISYKITLVPCCDYRIEAFYTMYTLVNMITLSITHPISNCVNLHYSAIFTI
jgi:hypothetical protein